MTKEEMLELRAMMKEVVSEELKPIKSDLSILKEEAAITRHTGNLLLKWAEKADRTVVNVGLYEQDE